MKKGALFLATASAVLSACGGGGSAPTSSTGSPPTSSPAPSPAPAPAPAPTPTTIAFAEEFNSTSLDRTIWSAIGPDFWVNNELQAYIDSDQTIAIRQGVQGADGGVLVLKSIWTPGQDTRVDRNADFSSGRIESRGAYDFTYGRIEARIKLPAGTGFWPAFWILGNGSWPDTGEIDVMEYVGDTSWISSAVHGPGYSGATPLSERFFFPAGTDVTDWHIYAVEWSEDAIDFLVDGTVFYRVSRADVAPFGAWAFDNPKYIILNFALGGDYPFAVNSVASPYRGLPQASVDAIQAGNVEMLVDWVRVTPP